MESIGIIPAAGKATRFGGLYKELLPLPDGHSLLEHTIRKLDFCDQILVITSPEKESYHRHVVQNSGVEFCLQSGSEMWGAIKTAYNVKDADRYFMLMPDTYIIGDVFQRCPKDRQFGLGYFFTQEPWRFGILEYGKVTDKYNTAELPATAWGALTWTKSMCDLWNGKGVTDYTQAINAAIDMGDWDKWHIGDYYDIANMERYMELLWNLK